MLGEERARSILFVASDMWRAFLNVVKKRCSIVLHVLDRFHVTQLMSKAIDQTRRDEVRALRAAGQAPMLTKLRWLLLKRPQNLTGKERGRLRDLLSAARGKIRLRSIRIYLLSQQFRHFWSYTTAKGGRRFLKPWTQAAMRSGIKPLTTFARTLRAHEPELLNWFHARGQFAAGATEGFNNKARVTTRKAYGFRSYDHATIALYHALGALPEPPWLTHRFC